MSDLALGDLDEDVPDASRLSRALLAAFVLIEAAWLIGLAALLLHLVFKV